LREVRRRIVCDDVNVTSALAKGREVLRFVRVHVDKIKMIEWRRHFKGARGTAFDLPPRSLGYMDAPTTERVDVVFF
jgi:hypothetical protein